jgi:hypothetical protein
VQTALQRLAHHARVGARGRGDQDRVEVELAQHCVVVAVGGDAGVLLEHAEHVLRRIAHRDELDLGMSVDDREMGQAHLAESDYSDPDHGDPRL